MNKKTYILGTIDVEELRKVKEEAQDNYTDNANGPFDSFHKEMITKVDNWLEERISTSYLIKHLIKTKLIFMIKDKPFAYSYDVPLELRLSINLDYSGEISAYVNDECIDTFDMNFNTKIFTNNLFDLYYKMSGKVDLLSDFREIFYKKIEKFFEQYNQCFEVTDSEVDWTHDHINDYTIYIKVPISV